jgi:hypothetical protein
MSMNSGTLMVCRDRQVIFCNVQNRDISLRYPKKEMKAMMGFIIGDGS